MYRHQEQVREFHKAFDQPLADKPTASIPTPVLELRCRLLLEEVLEFCFAAGFKVSALVFRDGKQQIDIVPITGQYQLSKIPASLVGMADALGDIQYVNDGAANVLGIDLEPIADEVHRSNMSKLWYDQCFCKQKLEKLYKENGISEPIDHIEGECELIQGYSRKDEYGKSIKPPDYSPADIATVLKKLSESRTEVSASSKAGVPHS